MEYPNPPLDNVKRLTIMILLERRMELIFSELQKVMGISKGALDSHLRVLEKFDYIIRERRLSEVGIRSIIIPLHQGLLALQEAKLIWKKLLE